MITGQITTTLRPLRLAFIVSPNDSKSISEIVKINSFLWGGSFNPIIYYYQRLPHKKEVYKEAKNAKEVFEGMLEAYDPDYVIRVGKAKEIEIDFGSYREVMFDKITNPLMNSKPVPYGVEISNIIQHLNEVEFKYVHRTPTTFHVPETNNSLFWNTLFGCVPDQQTERITTQLSYLPNYEKHKVGFENFLQFFRKDNYTIHSITKHLLNIPHFSRPCSIIYLMDDKKLEDITTFWNFRAMGWKVLPIPVASINYPSVLDGIADFIKDNYWRYDFSEHSYHNTTIIKSNSVKTESIESLRERIRERLPKKTITGGFPMFQTQNHIPRIWSAWHRLHNSASPNRIHSKEREFEVNVIDEIFNITDLYPPFVSKHGNRGPRYANEIELELREQIHDYAEVIPHGGKHLSLAIAQTSLSNLRCSKNGIVYYPNFRGLSHKLVIPKSYNVMKAWFKERGFHINLSDNGHIINHLQKQLLGTWGLQMLTSEAVVALIYKISSKKWIDASELEAQMKKIGNTEKFITLETTRSWLIKSNIIQLGIVLKCPKCRQKSWFSIKEADYSLNCKHCLEKNAFPESPTKEIQWAYKGIGAFSSKHGQQGSIPVILVIRFFKLGLYRKITALPSFTFKKGSESREVDLAILTQADGYTHNKEEVIYTECKSYNNFEAIDIKRMEELTETFENSICIYATLRRDLNTNEQEMIRRSAKKQINYERATSHTAESSF